MPLPSLSCKISYSHTHTLHCCSASFNCSQCPQSVFVLFYLATMWVFPIVLAFLSTAAAGVAGNVHFLLWSSNAQCSGAVAGSLATTNGQCYSGNGVSLLIQCASSSQMSS